MCISSALRNLCALCLEDLEICVSLQDLATYVHYLMRFIYSRRETLYIPPSLSWLSMRHDKEEEEDTYFTRQGDIFFRNNVYHILSKGY